MLKVRDFIPEVYPERTLEFFHRVWSNEANYPFQSGLCQWFRVNLERHVLQDSTEELIHPEGHIFQYLLASDGAIDFMQLLQDERYRKIATFRLLKNYRS